MNTLRENHATAPHVLVVGESWIKHTVHLKGFDQFHTTEYAEGGGEFLSALTTSGYVYDYIRAHEVSGRFPTTLDQLQQYDVVVLSDIGANSFLLTDEVFLRSEVSVNRLGLIVDYVRAGGGLVMVGGYMSFSGIDGRARYGMSPLADVLPVTMLPYDDRVETPDGLAPQVDIPDHPVLGGTQASGHGCSVTTGSSRNPKAVSWSALAPIRCWSLGAQVPVLQSRSRPISLPTGRHRSSSTGRITLICGPQSSAGRQARFERRRA